MGIREHHDLFFFPLFLRFWNRRKRCRCMLPSTMQSDKFLNGILPSTLSCNNCSIVHFKHQLHPSSCGGRKSGTNELFALVSYAIVKSDKCRLRWCQNVRKHVKMIRFTITRTQKHATFCCKVAFSNLEPSFVTQL